MKKQWLVLVALLALAGLALPTRTVAAATNPPDDGVVIWNEDYTLAAGAHLDGGLVVFNGDVTLESDSHINGDVVVWNGRADADGVVEGNLVAANGDIRLGTNALVRGDVVCSWNCDVEREIGARVDGDIVEGLSLRRIPFGQWTAPGFRVQIPVPEREPFWLSAPEQLLRWILRIVRTMVTVLVIAAIGGVVALIWPEATARVGHTAFQSPGASLGIGFLTLVASVTLIIALAITICLSPAAALIALALGATGLFGWVAIGARIGGRVLEALGAREAESLWVASLGTLIITLITMGLSAAFCLAPLGWLLMTVIGCLGLGAAVLTRFGTTPYAPGESGEIPEPPPPPPATGGLAEPPPPVLAERPPEPAGLGERDEEAPDA
ncbi:MAG: hypothetical protein R6X31_01535 [Anaerolineae bacterium]